MGGALVTLYIEVTLRAETENTVARTLTIGSLTIKILGDDQVITAQDLDLDDQEAARRMFFLMLAVLFLNTKYSYVTTLLLKGVNKGRFFFLLLKHWHIWQRNEVENHSI